MALQTQQCDQNTRRNNLQFLHGTVTCTNNIVPDSICKVVKRVVLYMKLWAGHRKGGCNCERKCRIPRISPPPAICTKSKVAKGGAYLRDTTVHELQRRRFNILQYWAIFGVRMQGNYSIIKTTHKTTHYMSQPVIKSSRPPPNFSAQGGAWV